MVDLIWTNHAAIDLVSEWKRNGPVQAKGARASAAKGG